MKYIFTFISQIVSKIKYFYLYILYEDFENQQQSKVAKFKVENSIKKNSKILL